MPADITIGANLLSTDPGTYAIFMPAVFRPDSSWQMCVTLESAERYATEIVAWADLPYHTVMVDGADAPSHIVGERYRKTFTQTELGRQITVSKGMNRWTPSLKARLYAALGYAYGRTLGRDGWLLVSGGFTDVGPDGVSLYNNAHPLANGTTYDNLGTSALDLTALAAARAVLRKWPTEEGIPMMLDAACLCVPPDLEQTAHQLTSTQYVPALVTSINPMAGRISPCINPYATDTTDWALHSAEARDRFLLLVGMPSDPQEFVDQETLGPKITDVVSHIAGYTAAHGTFGSQVAG